MITKWATHLFQGRRWSAPTWMGSFSSKMQPAGPSHEDDVIQPPEDASLASFLQWVRTPLMHLPPALPRAYRPVPPPGRGGDGTGSDKDPSRPSAANTFRLMTWNILSQALGTQADSFVACPAEALVWRTRRFRLLEELLVYDADVICLQEVDHFPLLERVLAVRGYSAKFFPKPDSPCIYMPRNSGPDGCAVFYRRELFELVEWHTRVLEVWGVLSNQVAILAQLRHLPSGRQLSVVTTHLKARKGSLVAGMRHEQGKDLLLFLEQHRNGRPAILCGDLNAEPTEAVYTCLTGPSPNPSSPTSSTPAPSSFTAPSTTSSTRPLASAYAHTNGGEEPAYTTWKIRQGGEVKRNIDYILFTEHEPADLQVLGTLDVPSEAALGADRAPSLSCPSDHFSLVADFRLGPQGS